MDCNRNSELTASSAAGLTDQSAFLFESLQSTSSKHSIKEWLKECLIGETIKTIDCIMTTLCTPDTIATIVGTTATTRPTIRSIGMINKNWFLAAAGRCNLLRTHNYDVDSMNRWAKYHSVDWFRCLFWWCEFDDHKLVEAAGFIGRAKKRIKTKQWEFKNGTKNDTARTIPPRQWITKISSKYHRGNWPWHWLPVI